MEIPKNIKQKVKDTVGYSETENKESFNVGADVAFSISESFYEEHIKTLQKELDSYKNAYNSTKSDLTTITTILNKYRYRG
jgi:hypothetical protein